MCLIFFFRWLIEPDMASAKRPLELKPEESSIPVAAGPEEKKKYKPPAKFVEGTFPTRYFGIDVEKGGARCMDSLIAIGIAVGSPARGVIEKKRWCFPNVNRFEPRCISEFWSKYSDLLLELTEEGKTKKTEKQFQDFAIWLAHHEQVTVPKQVPGGYNGKARLVTDNPSFDVSHVDFAWEQVEPDHTSLHYTRAGSYRPVDDPTERLTAQGIDWKKIDKFMEGIGVSHDHRPENDAEKHLWQLFISMAYSAFQRSVPCENALEQFEKTLLMEDAAERIQELAMASEEAAK